MIRILIFTALSISVVCSGQELPTSENHPKLKARLESNPELDLDNDGIVTLPDFYLFRTQIFADAPGIEPYGLADHADFDGNAVVDHTDYSMLRNLFGVAPGPSCCGIFN